MSADLYKLAAQGRYRFPSARGELNVEQLFDLPLKSKTGFDLDTVARQINGALKARTEESFVDDATRSPEQTELANKLEIVKDVIKTRQDAIKAANDRARKADERRKILAAIAAKQEQQLTQASLEQLEKQLEALDA